MSSRRSNPVTRVLGTAFFVHVGLTLLVVWAERAGGGAAPARGPAFLLSAADRLADLYARVGSGDSARGMLLVAVALWLPWFIARRAARRQSPPGGCGGPE